MVFTPSRMWHTGEGQPSVALLDRNGAVVNTFNLDVPDPAGNVNIAVMMPNGHKPERTVVTYSDGKERDMPQGYRYHAHLYYSMTNSVGRALCVGVINHLMAHPRNAVKFWPYRDVTTNWHICKLDEDPDVDGLIENRGVGYTLTLSLKGYRLEYTLPSKKADVVSNFNDSGAVYNPGDAVRDFGSVAAAYLPTDLPAYFSSCPSKGEPELPMY